MKTIESYPKTPLTAAEYRKAVRYVFEGSEYETLEEVAGYLKIPLADLQASMRELTLKDLVDAQIEEQAMLIKRYIRKNPTITPTELAKQMTASLLCK